MRAGDLDRDDDSTGPLTAAIARGDAAAFGRFYEAWFDRAYALARAVTKRDESFCLDVVQDAMMRVVKSMRRMDDDASLARWMRRVIHTTAIDRLRRDLRRARRESAAAAAAAAAASDASALAAASGETPERIEWIRARIDEMPERDRALVCERFERGRTNEEAGAALGISGDAAHGRLRRLLERLRAAYRAGRSAGRAL